MCVFALVWAYRHIHMYTHDKATCVHNDRASCVLSHVQFIVTP